MKKIVGLMSLALLACSAFAAGNFVHDSESVAYLNTSSAITAGHLVDLGDRYGVAKADIASNATGTVQIKGVWSFQRADTNAIAAGAAVYYSTASNVTGTAAADKYVGQCTEAAAVCTALTNSVGEYNKFVKVDINVPQRQCIVGTDLQAWDTDLDRLALNNGASLTNVPSSAITPAGLSTTNTAMNMTNVDVTIINGRITALTVH